DVGEDAAHRRLDVLRHLALGAKKCLETRAEIGAARVEPDRHYGVLVAALRLTLLRSWRADQPASTPRFGDLHRMIGTARRRPGRAEIGDLGLQALDLDP